MEGRVKAMQAHVELLSKRQLYCEAPQYLQNTLDQWDLGGVGVDLSMRLCMLHFAARLYTVQHCPSTFVTQYG